MATINPDEVSRIIKIISDIPRHEETPHEARNHVRNISEGVLTHQPLVVEIVNRILGLEDHPTDWFVLRTPNTVTGSMFRRVIHYIVNGLAIQSCQSLTVPVKGRSYTVNEEAYVGTCDECFDEELADLLIEEHDATYSDIGTLSWKEKKTLPFLHLCVFTKDSDIPGMSRWANPRKHLTRMFHERSVPHENMVDVNEFAVKCGQDPLPMTKSAASRRS